MTIRIISILMIVIGAIFLILSFPSAMDIRKSVSGRLHRKWLIILYLMGFFISCYILFDIILIGNLPFPVELVTGGVFFGGAFFVYIIINISKNTIAARQKAEEESALTKEDWVQTFDAVTDMITIHDKDFNIIRANPSAKSMFGLHLQEGMPFVKCFRCYHGTENPPSRCASCQSLQTGKPSMVEMFEPYLNRHLEIRAMPRFEKDHQLVGLIHVVRDITDRKRIEEALKEKEKFMDSIIQSSAVATFVINADHKVIYWNGACEYLTGIKSEDLLGTSDQWKAFYDHPRPCVADVIIDNKINEMTNFYKVNAKSVLIPDGIRAEGWYPNLGGKNRYVVFDAAPIRDENGKIIAAIETLQDITDRKKAEAELKNTLESLRKSFGTIVQVMVSAVESRDPYTAGHQIRSADLARAIATEMGLPQDKIEGLRMAGSIHDIGKLSIPAEILSKPTKLTNLEFSLIKEHSRIGYEMLKDVESPWPLAEIVYQHHERMDGSGYPRNLKGEEILLEARIMSVADVVEAMASHRPYRPGLGIEAALNEIEKNRGIFYDEAVVDACLRLFRKGFKLEGT